LKKDRNNYLAKHQTKFVALKAVELVREIWCNYLLKEEDMAGKRKF